MNDANGKSRLTQDAIAATKAAMQRHTKADGTPHINAIAAELGIARSTVQNRIRSLATIPEKQTEAEPVELPEFADPDDPIEEVIDRLTRSFERSKKAKDAKTWFPIKVADDQPIGVLFVGDPHVDDNGCAWPILRRHIDIAKSTAGMFAVNIGDVANDWGGRLIKKYADQDTSAHTARRLVEWFLLESGMPWLVWLHGNHQHMGNSMALHEEMNKRFGTKRVPMFDWEARFTLQFQNGEEFRINAAHDFPGNSMWNPVHGPVKTAMFGDRIDVVACGHKHNWAVSQWELAEQGTAPLMIRCRGYKHMDDYARRIGKYEQDEGQSILVVFDPNSQSRSGRVQAFTDIEKGAAYLSFLRDGN